MSLVVRPARDTELEHVGRLTVDAYVSDGLLAPDHWYVDELRDVRGRASHATLLVADDAGTLVGTVTVARHGTAWAEVARPHEAELRMLAVEPAGRGRGVGEALVRAGVEVARAAGAEALALTTLDAMHAAQRLYERLGFRRAQNRDRAVEGHAMFVYTLTLTGVAAPGHAVEGP